MKRKVHVFQGIFFLTSVFKGNILKFKGVFVRRGNGDSLCLVISRGNIHKAAVIIGMCASLTEGGQRLQYLVYGIGESRSTGGIECKVTYGKSVEHHAVNKPAYDYQLPQQRYTVSKNGVVYPVLAGLYPVAKLLVVNVYLLFCQIFLHTEQANILCV